MVDKRLTLFDYNSRIKVGLKLRFICNMFNLLFDPNAFKIYVKLEFYTFIMLIIKILRVLHRFNHFPHCSRFFSSLFCPSFGLRACCKRTATRVLAIAVSLNHIIIHCGFLSCFEMRTLRTAYVTIQSASHTQPTTYVLSITHTHSLSLSLSLSQV